MIRYAHGVGFPTGKDVPVFMVWLWLAALVAFVVLEAATAQLVSVWFILGSVAALVVSLFTGNAVIQFIVFVVVSGAALFVIRPLVKSRLTPPLVPTNSDMLIGKLAVVSETVINEEGKGRVTVGSDSWSARSYYGNVIPQGAKTIVYSIDGAKLIVYEQPVPAQAASQ